MSDHAWVLEHIESYLAGGLDGAECERLESHTAECVACAGALAEGREAERKLDSIFAAVRPGPGLEDRAIQSLRTGYSRRRKKLPPFAVKITLGAAAVILLGVLGSFVREHIARGELWLPGQGWVSGTRARNSLKQEPLILSASNPIEREQWDQAPNVSVFDDTDSMASNIRTKARLRLYESPSDPSMPLSRLGDGKETQGLEGLASARQWALRDQPMSPGGAMGGLNGRTMGMGGGGGGAMWGPSAPAGKDSFGDGGAQTIPGNRPPAMAEGSARLPALESLTADPNGKPAASEPATVQAPPGGFGLGTGLAPTPMSTALAPATRPVDQVYSYHDQLTPPPAVLSTGAQTAKTTETAPVAVAVPGKSGDLGFYFKPGTLAHAAPKDDAKKEPGRPEEPKPPVSTLGRQAKEIAETGKEKNAPTAAGKPEAPAAPAVQRKIIIRSGEIEFEVVSFDSAVATITKLVMAIPDAFVDTVNSDKLANGKVRGSVVVRVPPDKLDGLVLDLRKEIGKAGELKGLRIGSQDITKQYTDLQSRLRAARAMEERLLAIIKTGKGEIKDLLLAEKELGNWRTKIEEFEGELRYYGNLVALSTLTVTLYEKEIQAPFGVVETERVQMGLEVEDVEKAQRDVLAAVADAKGRVTKSELKQHGAGQYSAVIDFEVAPDAAGPLRDRLKQIGHVARLDLDRLIQNEGGPGRPQDGKLTRKDAQFQVSLYNLANVAPRETVHINLAAVDVETAYKTLAGLGARPAGRVVSSNLNSQGNSQTTGTVNLEVRSADADRVLQAIKQAGEVMRLQVTENPDTQNVTTSKRGFSVQIFALGAVQPRETSTLKLATRDVPAAYRSLQEAVNKAKGRILKAQLNEQDKQHVTAQLDFDVRRSDEDAITAVMDSAGDVFSRNVVRAADSDNVTDTKVRLQVELVNQNSLPPRETVKLGIEVQDVDRSAATLTAFVNEVKGRTVESHVSRERTGRITAVLVYDVPLADAPALIDRIKGAGTVRVQQSMRNPQAPEGKLATARLDVTLSNGELIVPSDDGLWPQVRKGLFASFVALSWSLTVVIVGVLFVLPWVLVIFAVYKLIVRLRGKTEPAAPAA